MDFTPRPLLSVSLSMILAVAAPAVDLTSTALSWTTSPPIDFPVTTVPGVTHLAYKDPSVVRAKDAWQIYASRVRHEGGKTRYALAYLSMPTWAQAPQAKVVHLLDDEQLACAPFVFRYARTGTWYVFYVWENRLTGYAGPAFSTVADIDRPETFTRPTACYPDRKAKPSTLPKGRWLDFTVIGDDHRMWLYFTDNYGHLLRSWTSHGSFPLGWSDPEVVLAETTATIFEGSQTYALPGNHGYLTFIEGIGPQGRRFFTTYTAKTLDGAWTATGTQADRPFAGPGTVTAPWSVHVSHGELLRSGVDERVEVDTSGQAALIYQGWDGVSRVPDVPLGKFNGYHEIPWRLGLLTPR